MLPNALPTLPADKSSARIFAANRRLAVHEALKDQAPLRLASLPFPVTQLPSRHIVSAFFATGTEIDTSTLLVRLAGDGWTTCLPVVQGRAKPLIFRRWLPGEPTTKAVMGIDIPLASAPEVEPDVLLVPLLAFDKSGYRLGYGGGFYDMTLAALRARKKVVAIGVAYSAQEVATVPHEAHDAKLDFMMTEKGLFACA